ncbi:MAG: 2-hydroxyacid dehydrogenase [Alphaproteobacteria bacterium]
MTPARASQGAVLVVAPEWDQEIWAAKLRRWDETRAVHIWHRDQTLPPCAYAAVWNPPPGALGRLAGLQVIFNLGAGVDSLLGDPALPSVPVIRSINPDLTGRMTEYVVCQVLHHHRRLPAYRISQDAHQWKALPQPVAGAVNVGVMGLGELGRAAAKALVALGFDVAGWSRSAKIIDKIQCFDGKSGLMAFLARTDILVCLLPATPETAGILNADLIGQLRPNGPLGGAVLINAGRGALQVEADIARALDAGTLIGASLDVFDPEPLAANSPLWDKPQVIITPHVAADSDPEAICRDVMEQIRAYEAGGITALPNRVDPDKGY